MRAFIDWALRWVENNPVLISVLSATSVVFFLASLIFIPWLILRLPADYFSNSDSDRYNPFGNHPVAIIVVDIIRNLLGIFLVTLGVILLLLPGQGLLTIILGIVVGRFPGN